MDKQKGDDYYVICILKYAEYIVSHMDGKTQNDLETSLELRDLISFWLIQISEYSKGLSSEFKGKCSEVPWSDISGLRNRLVHDYGSVDLFILYWTANKDIPFLKQVLEKYLKSR